MGFIHLSIGPFVDWLACRFVDHVLLKDISRPLTMATSCVCLFCFVFLHLHYDSERQYYRIIEPLTISNHKLVSHFCNIDLAVFIKWPHRLA